MRQVSIPLNPMLNKMIARRLFLYSFALFLLILSFCIEGVVFELVLMSLISVPLFLMMFDVLPVYSHSLFRFLSRTKEKQFPSVICKSELDKLSCNLIVPSITTIINRLTGFRAVLFVVGSIFLFPALSLIISNGSNHSNFWVAGVLYSGLVLSYLRLYFLFGRHHIVYSEEGLEIPIFGWFGVRVKRVLFKEIEESVVYGSREHLAMTFDENQERGFSDLVNAGSLFTQGLCLVPHKGKPLVLSSLLVPVEVLLDIQEKTKGDRMQLISEFN